MTVRIEDLLRWQPDNFGEDHLDNLILSILTQSNKWHLVYYNPPHGSWKSLTLLKRDYEYRQVGPKRGVKKMRRPDIAFQYLDPRNDRIRLFLIESKIQREDWHASTPMLLRNYFEGVSGFTESKGVRIVPFRHRRKRGEIVWKEITSNDPDREWFQRARVDYFYGFAYNIGIQSKQFDPSEDMGWVGIALRRLEKPSPPLVIMGLGWLRESFEPFVVAGYSESFPEDAKVELQKLLSRHVHHPHYATVDSFSSHRDR